MKATTSARIITTCFIATCCAAIAMLSACAQPEPTGESLTEDLATLVPEEPAVPTLDEHATLVYSNVYMKAVLMELPVGAAVEPHRAGSRIIYALDGLELRLTQGQSQRLVELGARHAQVLEPGEYAMANAAETPAHFLVVTRTEAELPETPAGLQQVDPLPEIARMGDIVLTTPDVVVFDVELAPGDSPVALANNLPRLIYAHQPASLEFAAPEEETISLELDSGEATWRDTEAYTIGNVGDSPADLTIFSFKG